MVRPELAVWEDSFYARRLPSFLVELESTAKSHPSTHATRPERTNRVEEYVE